MSENILEVKNLQTRFRTRKGYAYAVNGVSFHLKPGETLGVVGESGCGKSVTMLSLMRLLAQAKIDNPLNPNVTLEWRFKKDRPATEHEPASARPDADTDVVRFNFRMVNGTNPLALSGLRRVALPEKITN